MLSGIETVTMKFPRPEPGRWQGKASVARVDSSRGAARRGDQGEQRSPWHILEYDRAGIRSSAATAS